MSVKITAFANPFNPQKTIETVDAGATLETVIERHRHQSAKVTTLALVNGIRVAPETVLVDGDEVILRNVPMGETTKETGDKIVGWSWAAVAVGALLFVICPWVGGALMVVGVAGFITGASVTLYGAMGLAADTSSPDNVYSLHGATNKQARWGKIPIILGKHLIAPPYAASGYTEIGGTDGVDQYVRLLYVIGYGPLSVQNIKLGDQLVATNAADVRNGSIDCSTGLYDGVVEAEIRQDAVAGTGMTLYPYAITEENIGAELDPAVDIQRLTSRNVSWISIDVVFERGLFGYNTDGKLVNTSVELAAEYRLEGDVSWITLGTLDSGSNTITRARKELMRFTVAKTVTPDPAKGWEVRVRRVTALSTDANTSNTVKWTSFRYRGTEAPVAVATRKKICLLGIKVKATDAMNGILEQVNVEAQMVAPDYDGSGTGSANWVEGPTSNPASAFLHVIRSGVSARPRTDAEIDWPAFEAWHTWCETEGFECNAVMQASNTRVIDLLRSICSTARSSPTKKDGLISVVQDVQRTTVVQHITPRNSRGYGITKKFTEQPHALRIAFVNAAQGWAADECIVYDDGYTSANATTFKKLELWGITDYDHVWRQGRYLIACNKLRPEIHSVELDFEGLVCTRGDLVEVTHDVPMWGLAAGRIIGVNLDESDYLESIVVDNDCPMETGTDYRIKIRLSTGEDAVTADVVTVNGNNRTITFQTPIEPGLGQPAAGDLWVFGEVGYEATECIVTGMEVLDDLRVRLTMMEHAVGVFTADSGEIPAFDSKISKAPKFAPAAITTSPLVAPQAPQPPPALVVAEDHTTVTPVYDGLLCQETSTNSLWRYDGDTSAWVYVMLAHEASIRMTVSASRILRARSGDLSPDALTLTAYYSDNNDTYAGRFLIEVSVNGADYTTLYSSSSNEATHTESDIASTSGGSNIILIRCRLYKAGGTSILYEQQIIGVSADPSAAPLYWGPLDTAPTENVQPDDYYFDDNTVAEGGGVVRYFTGTTWAEMTSAHPLWKTVWGNVYVLTDAAEWASAQGTVVAAANAIFEKLYATSIISAYIFAQTVEIPSGGSQRWYDGVGVQRRCIEIKNGRMDFIDAPDTSPASDEVLRGRFGRLGVGETIIMDGEFVSPLLTPWAAESVINAAQTNNSAIIQLADGTIRAAYIRVSDGYLVERIWSGSAWGSESVINAASSTYPIAVQLLDGSIKLVYRRNSDGYLVERTLQRYARIGAGIIEEGVSTDGRSKYWKYSDGTLVQEGWDFVQGNGTAVNTKTLTMPASFLSGTKADVFATAIGYKDGSDPTHKTDRTAMPSNQWAVAGLDVTNYTTQILIGYRSPSTQAAQYRFLISWRAIGIW